MHLNSRLNQRMNTIRKLLAGRYVYSALSKHNGASFTFFLTPFSVHFASITQNVFTSAHAGIKALAILATSRPHKFPSEWSELFRPRSGRASDKVARSLGPDGVPPLQFFEFPLRTTSWLIRPQVSFYFDPFT